MAWTTPRTWADAEDVTHTLLNTHIRDNQNETAPGIASAAGRMIVTDGVNSIVERIPSNNRVETIQTTSSTSYTDLATAGPAVTVTTGTAALVILSTVVLNDTAAAEAICGVAISGATTLAAQDGKALRISTSTGTVSLDGSKAQLYTGLTAGSNTFTMKYRVTGTSTGTFARRELIVIPF